MRSSVSAILSDPVPDNTMSFPDYYQSAADHCRLLVLVAHVGRQLKGRTFRSVLEVMGSAEEVRLTDKSGGSRTVRVRYVDQYPTENNEWGEFQAHRRMLGVVSVGACSSQQELNDLCALHESVRNKYSATVYDSRCVVFSLPSQGSTSSDSEQDEEEADTREEEHSREDAVNNGEAEDKEAPDKPPPWFQPQNSKTRLLQYHGTNYSAGLKADMQDFISSLFWILESKRLESSRDSSERLPLLCAPFERKDFVGLDMESRNNRKRVLGRLKKHLADVSLQAGLLAEAWNYYQVAVDVLRPANDWLWLAASLEGLCAVSVILQERQGKGQSLGARGLSDDEIVEKYREAVIHYGKYKHAGIIETEASIKAVMILVKQGNFLLAAEFLQNVVFINLQMNDEEKIERFMALSDLYQQIGFKRKAAFFQRVAAMRCVAPQNPQHDWAACYRLMLEAVSGYGLDLSSSAPPSSGWPALQIQLLQELVGTSRKMGAHSASTRHMTYLLQHLFPSLSPAEMKDFSSQLSVLAAKSGGQSGGQALSLDRGLVLPPVNLYCLPTVTGVAVSPLTDNMTPFQKQSEKVQGPFLFTPIQNVGAGSARSSFRAKKKTLTWVQGDVAAVELELHNPLPVDLKVSNLGLLFDGVNFEVYPTSLVLPPGSRPQLVSLVGVPKDTGQLRILGYTHTVLGVKSMCQLKDIPCSQESPTMVQVIPALPQVQINCDILSAGVWSPTTGSLNLYSGENSQARLTLTNNGRVDVEKLSVSSECLVEGGGVPPVIRLDTSHLASQLPLAPGGSIQIFVTLTGVNDTAAVLRPEDSVSVASDSRWSVSGQGSLPSRSISTAHSLPGHSLHPGSGHLSLVSQNSCGSGQSETAAVTANVQFKVQYSGGASDQWARRGCQALTVVQLPSLQLSRWDMLPGDTAATCFLVLDLVNRTVLEMELTYAEKKTILIEAGDMCRVPVPVTKCSFSESLDWEGGSGVTEYLAGIVSLHWTVTGDGGTDRSGVATLDNISWTDEMVEMLRQPPLLSRLCVGDREVREGGEVEHAAGDVLPVTVTLSNHLLEPVHDCQLVVRLAQDQDLATRSGVVVRGGGGLGAAGTPGVERKGEVKPGDNLTHVTSLLPLVPGQFKLAVTATVRFRDRPHSWRLPAALVNVSIH